MKDRKKRSDQWNPGENIAVEIVDKYVGGKSARQLGFEYGVADVTITYLLKRRGIFVRNRSNAKRTNQIKEDIFDIITEESAYWIGFLLADGNVYHPPKRSKQLNLGLAERDWEHLEKFKKFIGSNKSLYYNKGGVFISFYSNRIVEKLSEYGIVLRKSKIAKVPEILKNNRHFWRGMIDGDGWVGKHLLGLCGTHNIVLHFRDFVISRVRRASTVNLYQHKLSPSCWQIAYTASYVESILSFLYTTGDVCLDRKRISIFGV